MRVQQEGVRSGKGRRKCGRSVRGLGGSGAGFEGFSRREAGVCGGQQEVGNECDGVSRMRGRIVKGTAELVRVCGRLSRKCGRSVS